MTEDSLKGQYERCIAKHVPVLRAACIRRMRNDVFLANELVQEALTVAWLKVQALLSQPEDVQRKMLFWYARNRWKVVLQRNGLYKRTELPLDLTFAGDQHDHCEHEVLLIEKLDRQNQVSTVHKHILTSRQLEAYEKRALLLHLGWHRSLNAAGERVDASVPLEAVPIEEVSQVLKREYGRTETMASLRMRLHRAQRKVTTQMRALAS